MTITVMTPSEVCNYFSITRQTLWRWTKLYKIPHFKINQTIRFAKEVVIKHLENKKW